jgi:mitochondrial ornithine carrier protein
MAENAILFFAYNELQNLIRRFSNAPSAETHSLSQLAVAAAGAGAITSFFLCVILFRKGSFRAVFTVARAGHQ